MSLKIWSNKVEDDKFFTTASLNCPEKLYGINITGGERISEVWPSGISFNVTSKYMPVDSFSSGPILIVSKRLFSVIDKITHGDGVEFLPVDIFYEDANVGEYFAVNIINKVDVLDHDRSDYDVDDDVIESVESVVIDYEKAPDLDMFMLDSYERIIFVSSKLSKEIESASFHGVIFKDAWEWRPF